MKPSKLATIALLTLMAPAAWAESAMTIEGAKAFETAPTAMSGGGFMEITNAGTTDDQLVGVWADFPRVELHTTEFTDGVAKMMHVDGIDVLAGETVALEPGGFHVMFMGLQDGPLKEGDTIEATLIFENAGEIPVTFDVVKRDMAAQSN